VKYHYPRLLVLWISGKKMPSATISSVFERFGAAVKRQYKLSKEQHKVLSLIWQCRTGKLGAHKEQCNSCGHQKIHYNSCGNRHCPNCQGVYKERWFLDRSYDLELVYTLCSSKSLILAKTTYFRIEFCLFFIVIAFAIALKKGEIIVKIRRLQLEHKV
jgi:hypothetical protein